MVKWRIQRCEAFISLSVYIAKATSKSILRINGALAPIEQRDPKFDASTVDYILGLKYNLPHR